MKILFAPFAARLPGSGGSSPKNYPYPVRLNELLEQAGHEVIQVGSNQEPQISKRIERGRTFREVGEMLQECDTFIGVDSYLQHHAWLVRKPGIVLWGPSDYRIFGHDLHTNLVKDIKFARERQYEMWTQTHANPEGFVKPEEVIEALAKLRVASTPDMS